MGKYRFAYWFILITTLIMESSLQILYSYVTKKTLNAIEFQNMQFGIFKSDWFVKWFMN